MRRTLMIWMLFPAAGCLAQSTVDSTRSNQQAVTEYRAGSKKFPWQWVIPGALVGMGVWGNFDNKIINRKNIQNERNEHLPVFHKRIDNYLPYIPIATTYLLGAFGNRPKHDVINHSVILLKSELLMIAIVTPLKKFTHVLRPDSADYKSFPSGHTAQAFLAANYLRHEYGYKSIWYSIAGYTVATGVAVLRIANNDHWVSDVFAGAGIGILCSEFAYATHQYRWNKKFNFSVTPSFINNTAGFYLVYKM